MVAAYPYVGVWSMNSCITWSLKLKENLKKCSVAMTHVVVSPCF